MLIELTHPITGKSLIKLLEECAQEVERRNGSKWKTETIITDWMFSMTANRFRSIPVNKKFVATYDSKLGNLSFEVELALHIRYKTFTINVRLDGETFYCDQDEIETDDHFEFLSATIKILLKKNLKDY